MKGPGREQVAPSLLAAASIFLVASAIVVDGAAYATAAAEPKAEVNGGRGQRVRFGERTASITRLSDGYSQGGGGAEMEEEAPPISSPRRNLRGPTPRPLPTSNIDSADISLEAPAKEPRISRRKSSSSPPSAQLVDEIPIVQKSRASSNAAGSQTRGQTRSRDELRHRAPQTPSYFSPPSDSASSISASSEQQSSSSSSLESGAVQQQYQSRNSNSNRSRSPPPSRSTSSSPSSSSSSSLQPRDRDFVASRVVGSSSSCSHRSGAAAKTKTAAITAAATKTTTTTTTTTSSTTTARPFFPRNFSLANAFDWLPQNLFNFSGAPAPTSTTTTPTASATKKPPKKYKPSPTPTATHNEVKPNYPKAQLPPKGAKDDVGPFRIALPTINFFNPPTAAASTKEATSSKQDKGKRATAQPLRERFNCPRESEVRFQLFPKICKTDKDCSIWNRDELCCEIFGAKSCVSGMPKPLEESSHMPILGLIPRKCPTRPLAELWWDVQECETDNDCWPRVCCPDGRRRYCRTSQPELEVVPVPVKRSFNYLSEYLECTPPPPRIFDLHPKACTSTFDCFPNVCCQEAGLRHCRPPKKSLLTWMANFLNVDFVKRLTQNIVIK